MNDHIEVLRGLVAKWRDPKTAQGFSLLGAGLAHHTMKRCADELEAALAAMGGQGEVQPVAWVIPEDIDNVAWHDGHTTPGIKPYSTDERTQPLYTTPPPSAVPEGLTARDRSVLRFALHRFMGEAYARHNEASQKATAGLYAPGAAERFYRDAKDAERLLSVFAAAPEPGEAAGGQRLRPLLDPGPEPMNDNRNTPNCELCRQALRSALGDGPALPLDAVGIQGDTKLCIGCGQSLPGQPAAPEPGEVDSD